MQKQTCKLCGKTFVPHHFNQKICDDKHYKPCPVCGKPVEWKGYIRCCSKKCSDIKRKNTCLDMYGSTSPAGNSAIQDKMKQTTLSNYGVEYPGQDEEIRSKQVKTYLSHYGKEENPEGKSKLDKRRISTCRDKYGVDYVFQSEDFQHKARQSSFDRYGVENPMMNSDIQKKQKASLYMHYGVTNPMKSEEIVDKLKAENKKKYGYENILSDPKVRDKISETFKEKYGVPWYCMTDDCKQSNGHIVSKLNLKFGDMLENKRIKYQPEYHLGSYSYDFLLNDYNTFIEIDPTITHTDLFNIFDKSSIGLAKDYHLNKTEFAEKNGYRCIHIFDWDDWNDILLPILNSKLNDDLSEYEFKENYDVDSYTLGYYKDDTCIQALKFENTLENIWTLSVEDSIYYDNHIYERLYELFLEEYSPEHVFFYEDKAKSYNDVSSYDILHVSEPQKIWSKGNDTMYDYHVKSKWKDDNIDNVLINAGWYSIYDCGRVMHEIF